MREFNFLWDATGEGVKTHSDGEALNNNIREWLATPAGTVADYPAWGHELNGLLMEPASVDAAVLMELSIVRKLPRDVKGITIRGIRVNHAETDLAHVIIAHQFGVFTETMELLGRTLK